RGGAPDGRSRAGRSRAQDRGRARPGAKGGVVKLKALSGPIWLASASPRRKLMLEEAGIDVWVQPPDVDDSRLRRGCVTPEQWVVALAFFKARRLADQLRGLTSMYAVWWEPARFAKPGLVIGADTVCVAGDCIMGQPRDAAHAREMLRTLRNA